MMGIELGAEGPGRIKKDLVLHDSACLRTRELPAALIQFAHGERVACTVFGAHPVYVLREVAHLVPRVPNRKLQLALRRTFRKYDLHFDQMLPGFGEGNGVVSCSVG